MMRLMCLKQLMLVKPLIGTSVLIVITGTFLRKILHFSQKHVCHNLIQKTIIFNDFPFVSVKVNDYRIKKCWFD